MVVPPRERSNNRHDSKDSANFNTKDNSSDYDDDADRIV